MLRIQLLGTPLVFLDEKPIQIQRKLQRALLYYLASQDAPVSRSSLIELFWHEGFAEADTRRRLREALSKLRLELPEKDYLITEHESVSLDFKRVWVDVRELRGLVQRIWRQIRQVSLDTPLPAAIASELNAAVNLWHGERFLEGANLPDSAPLDDWLTVTTRDLDYLHQQTEERLAYHLAATGDLERAIYHLREAIKKDELNEGLHLQMLTWMQAAGAYASMMAYCETLKKLYRQESGLPLPASLERICHKIGKTGPAERAPRPPAWAATSDAYLPFVGREELLNTLKLHFQRGGSAVILGETGAGKTHLVRQLFLSLHPEPRLLRIQARSSEHNLPFQPVIDMLRSAVTPEEWLELPKTWASSLAWILPELLTLRPEIVLPASTVEEARSQIFEALHQLLNQITRSQRALVFLDDAQWCDEASLSVLVYLLNHGFFKSRGFLILAVSPGGLPPELQDFLNLSPRQADLMHYPLPELQARDVFELTRFFFEQPPSDRLVKRLLHDTGGNPLFLIETLRALLDSLPNSSSTAEVEDLPLPGSIYNLAQTRLRGLTPHCRELLETAAVTGYAFTPEVLERILEASPDQVAADLDELHNRHLIRPDERGVNYNGYVFVHDIFREVLQRGLTPARRRLLHLRVAKGLEAQLDTHPESSSAVLADHYQAAGNVQRACRYWIMAAEYALHLFSPAEALAAFRRAEELLRQEHSLVDDDCILQIYNGLAELAFDDGDIHGMLHAYSVLQHYGEQRTSAVLLGSAHSGKAIAYFWKSDLYTAQNEIELALRYLRLASSVHELMKLHIRRGTIWQALFRLKDAEKEFEKAVEFDHDRFEPAVIKTAATALDRLAILSHLAGWPEKALQHCEHSLRHHHVLGHTAGSLSTNSILAVEYHLIGSYSQSLEISHKELGLARQRGQWRSAGLLHLAAGRTLLLMGQLDEAWKHVLHMKEHDRRFGSMDMIGDSQTFLGYFYMATDSLPEAVSAFRDAIDQAGLNQYQVVFAQSRLAFCLAQLGDMHTGLPMLEDTIEFTERNDLGRVLVPARLYHAILIGMLGRHDEARRELEWALGQARQRRIATTELSALLRLGDLDLKEGQPQAAAEKAGQVIATASGQGDRLHELSGLQLAIQVNQFSGCSTPAHPARMREILAEIELGSRTEAVRPYFEKLHSYYSALIGPD